MAPKQVLAKTERASGVLPVNAAARAASTTANKQPAARLKFEVRRLPPGLTAGEFEETLGEEWKLGKGKIDWREYRHGKIRAPGKLPEQSRCYIHLTSETHVKEFEQRFLAVVFHDKAGTHKNADLRHLPPTLGYAPNQRIPTLGKQRTDNRQGTIDQDPEFIAFLEAETQPIPKAAAIDVVGVGKDEVKVEIKSTPLIDDLREKKANKAKAAASKAERKAASKNEGKDGSTSAKDKASKPDPKKSEPAKEVLKTPSKQAASKAAQPVQPTPTQPKATAPAKKKKEKPTTAQASPKPAAAVPVAPAAAASPAPQRMPAAQRARRDAEGIKKMLQKDLGIKPKDGSVPTGPARLRAAQQSVPTAPSPTPEQSQPAKLVPPASPAPQAAPTLKAFLKHANPSQGMTEALIKEALAKHAEVESVAIDPRKGTAIAVFKSQEALLKAIQVRKVSVASGAVEVLEFRDRSASNAGAARSSGRGGSRGGRGRGASIAASTPAREPAPG